MTWVRIDDTLPTHPKLLAIESLATAGWLHICALCYCAHHLTDGFVPANAVPILTAMDNPLVTAEALCSAGIWEHSDGGFVIHDYLDYQPSRETVQAKNIAISKKRSLAGKRSGEVRRVLAEERNSGDLSFPAESLVDATNEQKTNPIPSLPLKKEKEKEISYSKEFEDFWTAYPRKDGKFAAGRAFTTRLNAGAKTEALTTAAANYALSRKDEDAKFTKTAAAWLNQHRDDDFSKPPEGEDKSWMRW